MIRTLVTAGCSFTKDYFQPTWADYLSKELHCNLINVGARGAGLDFISKRIMIALNNIDPKDVLVGILLPSVDRFDYYVDTMHASRKSLLSVSSWQNGKNPNFVTLDGELSAEHGYCLTGGNPRGIKKYWYKYYHNTTAVYINYWFNVINIQNFLKLHKFKYFFSSAYDLDSAIEQPSNQDNQVLEYTKMKELVDFNQFIMYRNNQGFLSFVNDQMYEIINHHPVSTAHFEYVKQVLLPVIKNDNRLHS